jgi:DNA-binding transcriptional MerR regulator
MAAALYPIRAVARMTGLSVDTLRAWERRYQAVVPIRNDRGRTYSERHVVRLKELAALVAAGHAIGSIASLPDVALRRLRSASGDAALAHHETVDLEPLLMAIKAYDLEGLETILNRHALLLPPAELIFGVILPAMRTVGTRWESGGLCPAQEHLMSGVVRGILGGLLRSMPRPPGATRLVFAAPAGERHELGLLCGAVMAAAAGYAVIYLGPDLPATDIAHAVHHSNAAAVILARTAADAGVRHDLKPLKRLPEPVAVWVGGSGSDMLRAAIGARARQVASLEDLRGLLDRHAA